MSRAKKKTPSRVGRVSAMGVKIFRRKRSIARKATVQRALSDLRTVFPELRQRRYAEREAERRSKLIAELRGAYEHKGLVLYVGAGVSRSIGLPTWPELIRSLTVRMMTRKVESAIALLAPLQDEQRWKFLESVTDDLDEQELDQKPILMLARSIKEQMKDRLPGAIASILYRRSTMRFSRSLGSPVSKRRELRSRLSRGAESPPSSALMDALVGLARAERDARGVQSIITYNYDDLLEENLLFKNVRCTTALSGSQRIPDGSLPVYHVHGLVSVRDYAEFLKSDRSKQISARGNFVFSEDEYHAEYSDPYKWSNMTQISHLGKNIGLFVGLSMQDPNLRRLIDVTHKQYPENFNFAILRRPTSLSDSSDSKQTLLRNMFEEVETQSFEKIGVRAIWVDSHEEVAAILQEVAKRNS
jgi:hypothetical protein